ncbi:armadillo repeat-containing X-linked protein 3-like [Uloborus diversus]|uniref:armadillo repeat-containing X-linked protein 3-like n=1 Tax=Uloborus diversus TaxID=327109 RepID=UPI002409AE4C|nr:armadillo repeat-containing X-linked protein 3-like [Uloborus diversus]
MASDDNRLVEKVAFCSVLCAGFAYAGYNVVSKMCLKRTKKKENSFSQTSCQANASSSASTKSTQTEEERSWVVEECVSPRSVRERVNDLNLTERLRKKSIPLSPEVKPPGFRGSPWSSPLGCAKYLSVSAENISTRGGEPPASRRGSPLGKSQGTLDRPCISEQLSKRLLPFRDESITLKTLGNLQRAPQKMTAFEVKNLVRLLTSVNEEIVLKTLYTISNCAAFTTNQELLCESECPKQLHNLMLSQSEAVRVAVTQAISNISVVNKSYRFFQPHIPILLSNAVGGKELLRSLSLTALANLALDPLSHGAILRQIGPLLEMARSGTSVAQLQALRLLVNLSCNREVIPSLLMTEVPSDMLDMLKTPHDRELLLRLLTFLANIATFAADQVDGSSRPTLLSTLYRFVRRPEFEDLSTLCGDQDEDLSFQARRLRKALTAVS